MRAYEFALPEHVVTPEFEAAVALAFKGFTRWRAEGAWWGPEGPEFEKVIVFRVALRWRDILNGAESTLFNLVMDRARQAGEKAVYYGTPGRPAIYATGN